MKKLVIEAFIYDDENPNTQLTGTLETELDMKLFDLYNLLVMWENFAELMNFKDKEIMDAYTERLISLKSK